MKFRSRIDYASIYNSDRNGINLGIDSAVFLKKELTPRVFNAPTIGTQGKSTSANTAITDISALTDTNLRVSVDGGAIVNVTLSNAGKTTGNLIAAELESKINTALIAAGQDGRVWVEFVVDHYIICSQKTGITSSVVVTNGLTLNIADDLDLGTANTGTETVGTNDEDFLLYTTGNATYKQDVESNAHRSGRSHTGIVKKKKMAEWSFATYINMFGSAGDSIDKAVRLLWEQLLGTEVVTGSSIQYKQGIPNTFASLVRCSTIFGEYFTGLYTRDMTLTQAGDAAGTEEWSGKGAKRTIAGLSQVNGAVVASADVILNSGEAKRYDVGAPVMLVDIDGRTVLYGQDGSLLISNIDLLTHKLTLNASVSIADNSFVVPWNPAAFSSTGRDAIFTDLVGSIKLNQTSSAICATNIQLAFVNDHTDFDNCFGSETNLGYAAANRMTITLTVTFDLSNENFAEVVQAANFAGFSPEIIIGDVSGRHLKITAPKWIPSVPSLEVPENGVTPVTLEGILYQSAAGANDAILVEFK